MNTESDANEEKGNNTAKVEGSGAIAQDGGVAAGRGGVAVGRDVYGDIHIGDKVYTRSQVEELHDYLARAVAAYERRMYQLIARPLSSPEQPYKFLYAFEIEDADTFFGRDVATEELFRTVLKDRLTVLHAKSGAGKTSLLNAGLSPRLIREGYLPVYARAYDDPVRAIKRAIAPPWLGQWPELLDNLTLQEFLGQIRDHLSRQIRKLVIILDQFEEFFVFWPEPDHRQPFIDALADSYDDKSVPVHFFIGIRSDYFTYLATLQHRLPSIFHNEYYLDAMTREDAQEAVTRPVAKLGLPVTYEQTLLDTLLDDLARGGMELPHLQIICTRLYETLAEGKTTITLVAYEELGRAEGMLGRYLSEVLTRLSGKGQDVAREVLKELVSSEATKRVLNYDVLAARVAVKQGELVDLLAQLVNARLLSRNQVACEVQYEIAHEYLIQEIREWIDLEDLEFKRAQELLEREVANWRVHGTLIPTDRLKVLHAQRERLRGLEDEQWECILQSVLHTDFEIEAWVNLAGESSEKAVRAALSDPSEKIRRVATNALGAAWRFPQVSRLADEDHRIRRAAAAALGELGDPRAVEPLGAALRDSANDVREAAALALVKLGKPAVELLLDVLRSEDWYVCRAAIQSLGAIWRLPQLSRLVSGDRDVRWKAAEALELLGDPRAVEPLLVALRDRYSGVRWKAAAALGEIGDTRAVQPLVNLLEDPNWHVRQVAARALVKLGAPPVEANLAALLDQDGVVRCEAATALGELGDPRAVKLLITALQDANIAVCQSAAEALGKIGDSRAVEPLSAALRDASADVRQAVTEALTKIGTPEALAALEESR